MVSAFERTDEEKYGTWNEDKPIIQIRDAPGGKASNRDVGSGKYRKSPGRGFPVIDEFLLDVAKDMPEYSEYVEMISMQLLKVMKIFYKQGLFSDEEINNIMK